ncbi:MAG: response regulator transcription factor [Nevskia sp.]|jgi:DNA-binding response OmpR family regulator|nr:response regulator transcription factor [Nevskia sp.]
MLYVKENHLHILLVEDDEMLGEVMRDGVLQDGHQVDWVRSVADARAALQRVSYALILLDLGLPDEDGSTLIRDLRRSGSEIRILVVSARDEVGGRVACLRLGADDYIVKPFDLDELCARIDASTRRISGRASSLIEIDGLLVDTARRNVSRDGEDVVLSAKEYVLLMTLINGRGKVFSREQLECMVYGEGVLVESNTIEVHIHNLRKKLGGNLIRTIRGHGYVIG